MEEVVLVDKDDKEIGTEEKLKAHKEGKLHRAISVFIFNKNGEMLLQRRALSKYHAGGLWSNTCCSHPRKGEAVEKAAHRRLREEMGFDTKLEEAFSFIYKVKLDHDLFEHEYDHVLIGFYEGKVKPDPKEASEYNWVDINELKEDVKKNPKKYTPWFMIALDRVLSFYKKI